jgi:hypothetical protein
MEHYLWSRILFVWSQLVAYLNDFFLAPINHTLKKAFNVYFLLEESLNGYLLLSSLF